MLKLLPLDIVSMSHVKEASHALVHLEDWQVVALKEKEPKYCNYYQGGDSCHVQLCACAKRMLQPVHEQPL